VIPAYCCSPRPRNNSARTATSPVCACSTRTVSTTCRLPRRERELSPGGRSRAGAARQGRLSPEAHKTIHGFLGNEGEALLTAVNDGDTEASARLVRELLDRHGTGRVLFRNTRAAVQGFPERKLHPYPLPCPDEYLELPLGDHAELYPEVSFQAQPDANEEERWWKFDPRVEWLIDT
jgi:hypothetical protein